MCKTETVDMTTWDLAGWRLFEPRHAAAVLLEPPPAATEQFRLWEPREGLPHGVLELVREALEEGEPTWHPSSDWLSGEDEVDEHIRAGSIREFASPEELIAHLQRRVDERACSEDPDHPEVR